MAKSLEGLTKSNFPIDVECATMNEGGSEEVGNLNNFLIMSSRY